MMDETNDTRRDAIQVDIKEFVDGKCTDIKDIMDARFRALETKIQSDSEKAQRAIDRAESDYNTRFATTNEWRAALKDRETTFATRDEVRGILEKISSIVTREEYGQLVTKVNEGISRTEHDALITQMNTKNDSTMEALNVRAKGLEEKINDLSKQMWAMLGGLLITVIVLVIEIWFGNFH